ncbi:hypothetical protein ARMSODRAFT_1014109 [Armillaria solidipes]|uniref:MYND-type domain-containing protein n=1 Tax=Armillaria solidipes TaxID=1076256 RepID=A0A2H3CA03_9AGAR|nr:hypothetical protein ARMSODRAFT_1014109 [Armillaria solidipes]
MNEDKQSFISLKAKVLRNRYLLPRIFGILQRRFEEFPTDLILFDPEAQDLYETFFKGLRDLRSSKNEILRPNGNSDLFQPQYDSEYLDESTIWAVIEQLYELIYSLLRADEVCSREIVSGPYISITSHLYLKVIQSNRPLPHLEFLLEKPLLRLFQIDTASPRYTRPFTDTPHSLMMTCFQRIITRIQDPTISPDARLRVHTFLYIVSLSSDKYNQIFLANRVLYWFSLSMARFLPHLTGSHPSRSMATVLVPNMDYLVGCLAQSGPEYTAEALDAGILNTLLNLHPPMPPTSDALMHAINWLHMGLVFRGVLRRARRALDKIEQDGTESVLRSGKTKDAWMAMKATAKRMHTFKCYYHSQALDNDQELECTNAQRPNPNVGRHPKRCTGCWIRLFCSRECQKAGWKAHRQECRALAQGRRGNTMPYVALSTDYPLELEGISGPMGEHDSFYVRQCALEELKANARYVRDLKREYLRNHPKHPLRRLVVVFNYALLPRTISITSVEDLEEEVASSEPLADADEGRAQVFRVITPWKGGPAGMVLNANYTPEYPSDEHLVIRGL